MALDLRLMRYVIAVAEEGSFRDAAQRLHVAQPALSRQIRQLERELGVELFERRPTRVAEPGRVFVDMARKVLADVETTTHRTRLAARGELGTVRVGYSLVVSDHEMRTIADRVRNDHPGVDVEGHDLTDTELHAAIERGDIDLAIGRGLSPRPGFTVEPLRREPLVAVLPTGHPLARRPTVALRDLRAETFRTFPRRFAPAYFDLVVARLHGTGETFEIWQNPHPGLRNLADRDLDGFTLVPASIGDHLLDSVTCTPLSDDLPPIELAAAWHPASIPPPGELFIRSTRQLAADQGWLTPD